MYRTGKICLFLLKEGVKPMLGYDHFGTCTGRRVHVPNCLNLKDTDSPALRKLAMFRTPRRCELL